MPTGLLIEGSVRKLAGDPNVAVSGNTIEYPGGTVSYAEQFRNCAQLVLYMRMCHTPLPRVVAAFISQPLGGCSQDVLAGCVGKKRLSIVARR